MSLPVFAPCGSLVFMNARAVLPENPAELRPLLHAEIDRLPDDALAAAHKALLQIETRQLADELGKELDEEWASGRITKEGIAESILEHRRKHPYR
jgi:hypothetical protein